MIKRVAILSLVVLVAMISNSYADDNLAAPEAEKAPADTEQLPPGVSIIGDQQPVPSNSEELEQLVGGGNIIPTARNSFRWRFSYPFRGGIRYGWRYPIRYWNTFGRKLFGTNCRFGRPWGGYFYC
ncbi:hypothetical protein CCR75_006270 [Bremia lactucae]|uniref:Secreted protein n=1 Tax=Bremia lactucae TaxID=4779 RepID=A0A976FGB2_BRELC|nr:hypothetical protein CCR75_006270 [Bremia lactucae]